MNTFNFLSGNYDDLMTEMKTDFISDGNKILEALDYSAQTGTAVGISSPSLGSGIYITAVDKILNNIDFFDKSEITIILRGYDVTGHFFARNMIKLHEIKAVWPLRSLFENPFFKKETAGTKTESE